jgi:hypothetical protein
MMQIIYLTKKRNQQIYCKCTSHTSDLFHSMHPGIYELLRILRPLKALEQTCLTITYNDFVMIMSQKAPHHNNRFLIYDNFQQPLTESLEDFLKFLLY